METAIVIISLALILAGIAGSVLPVLPGPPLSLAGLLLLHFFTSHTIGPYWLAGYALVTLLVVMLDYWIPIWGAKKYGGSRIGVYGSVAGMLAGVIFFPPFGIIVGAALGAYIGELLAGRTSTQAIRAAKGTLIGMLTGATLKVALCMLMLAHGIYALLQ